MKRMWDQKEIEDLIPEVPVKSVNSKTGDVVLDATDIKLTTNKQTVQDNFIRIDTKIDEIEITSVDGLDGGTIESSTTIIADSNKDYPLTLQSNARDQGGTYEGGAYVGFKNKIGNVLGYLGIDRDHDAVLNKGGKDYKLGFPISDYIRARRMYAGQGPVTLPFGTVAFTLAHDMTITWKEYTSKSQTTGTEHSITTSGPCIMYLTKTGNSGVKNEAPMASGLIGYVTGEVLNPYDNRSFLTKAGDGFKITGTGMLYYISAEDLGTDR